MRMFFNINLSLKRLFDLIFSMIFLIILFPLFLIISLFIRINSKGPIFFMQKRLTINGRIFTMYKFRTMYPNSEFSGSGLYTFKNDRRITFIGKFLRVTSLDELPQLFNILIGDMSFVGPRPPVLNELGPYYTLKYLYKKRFIMKAGLTGFAQVKKRNEASWIDKNKYDLKYINYFQKFGIFFDFFVLALTFIVVLKKSNIFETKKFNFIGLTDEEIAFKERKELLSEVQENE
jgi:lipopolysaccharide/colanic/teichoic acid biosynthesis glycosyltransferase